MKVFTWRHRLIVLATTSAVVLVFGGLGWWIGARAGSVPAGIMIAVLLSYPVSLWLTVTRVKQGSRFHDKQEDR